MHAYAAIWYLRRKSRPTMLSQCKHFGIMLATRASSRMIYTKDGAVRSACSFIQNKRFVVAMPICKEVSEAVHTRQRVRMLRPEHLLSPRQRLPVHRFRL